MKELPEGAVMLVLRALKSDEGHLETVDTIEDETGLEGAVVKRALEVLQELELVTRITVDSHYRPMPDGWEPTRMGEILASTEAWA